MIKYSIAVSNITENCLAVGSSDRVVVVTDRDREEIGRAIYEQLSQLTDNGLLIFIEDFVSRPAKEFPKELERVIRNFSPTASVYAATGKPGELPVFRQPLRKLLVEELRVRHAHMIGIDERLMLEGMSQDYKQVQKTVAKLYEILKNAREIRVTDPHGSDLVVKLSPKLRWKKCDGIITEPGFWTNLPDGEVFTCPEKVDGKVVAWVIGDHFSETYGVLRDPLIIEIKDSRITKVTGKNKKLVREFREYISQGENSNRVGEFAVGALLGLREFSGNLLQDEKFPGIHMAFGGSYPEDTGAEWDAESHVDVIPKEVTIKVDGKTVMKDGRFTIKL